jgi:hypothetical protein
VGADVGLFSVEQAREYLTQKLTAGGAAALLDEVDELAADLQHLPLALAQAAAFLLDRRETCANYRRRFADEKRALSQLFPPDASADDYQATVATTWSISVDAADALNPIGLSRPLLEMASVVIPNGFPAAVLHTDQAAAYAARRLPPGSTAPTEIDCRDAVSNLARLSLITITPAPGGGRVGVHALVQRARRTRASRPAATVRARVAHRVLGVPLLARRRSRRGPHAVFAGEHGGADRPSRGRPLAPLPAPVSAWG